MHTVFSLTDRASNQALIDTVIRLLLAGRLTRALQAIEKLKKNTVSEEEALAECALRGFLMNGIAPFDKPMWDLAEEIIDDEGLAMLLMWAKRGRHSFPAHLDERLGHPAISEAHFERLHWESGHNHDTLPPYHDILEDEPAPMVE